MFISYGVRHPNALLALIMVLWTIQIQMIEFPWNVWFLVRRKVPFKVVMKAVVALKENGMIEPPGRVAVVGGSAEKS